MSRVQVQYNGVLLPYHVSEDAQFTDDLHVAGRLAGPHHVVTRHRGLEEAVSRRQRDDGRENIAER